MMDDGITMNLLQSACGIKLDDILILEAGVHLSAGVDLYEAVTITRHSLAGTLLFSRQSTVHINLVFSTCNISVNVH